MTRRMLWKFGAWLLFLTPLLSSAATQDTVPVRVSNIRDFIQHLQWSPDGKKFLFTRIHAGKMALWTMNVDGTDLKQLLPNNALPHFDGHWSPDGKQIILVHDVLQGTDGHLQIDVVNADGSGQKNVFPYRNAFEESPRLQAPDGKASQAGQGRTTRTKTFGSWTPTAKMPSALRAIRRRTTAPPGRPTANTSPLPAAAAATSTSSP